MTQHSPLNYGRLRSHVNQGHLTVGTFLGSASPIITEVCATSGVDWVLLDLEHGAGGEEQVRTTVLAAGAYGVPTLVRVESHERIRIGRVLDLGVAGIMFPRVETAQQALQLIRHMQYPPHGDRGVATYNRAARFGLDPAALEVTGQHLTVIQIESARAVQNVHEIAAIDGVDVLFVGPRDLSHDLGVPGDFASEKYQDAIACVLDASKTFGKICGTLVANGDTASSKNLEGWKSLAIGSDTTLLANSLTDELRQARS